MTTRTFPIFRSLQRAIGGGTGVGKQPALASVTVRPIDDVDADKNRGEEVEENNDKVYLPEGYHIDSVEEEKDGILTDNPNTWPINSEKARQLRREFAQEGFRRLYSLVSGHSTPMFDSFDMIAHDNASEGSAGEPQGVVGITADLSLVTDSEQNRDGNQDERPLATPINENENWMHFAQ